MKKPKKDMSRFLWQPGDVKITTSAEKLVEEQWTKYGKAKKNG